MTLTHTLAILFTFAGLITAVAAAWYWRLASHVYVPEPKASISDVPELHIMSGQVAAYESSKLNSTAATLTGLAAILSGIGSVLGVL